MKLTDLFTEDRAVSPVIGVILMVAITVILAAVIGTFVLDLGNSAVQQNPQAAVSFDQNGGEVTITISSIQNADTIEYKTTDVSGDGNDDGTGSWTEIGSSNVGDSVTVGSTNALEATDKITVRADLKGNKAVLSTYEVK
jgi:flagellin-like protein